MKPGSKAALQVAILLDRLESEYELKCSLGKSITQRSIEHTNAIIEGRAEDRVTLESNIEQLYIELQACQVRLGVDRAKINQILGAG